MRARDILLMGLLFGLGFAVGEVLLAWYGVASPMRRFTLRLAFLVQYGILISWWFDRRDNGKSDIPGSDSRQGIDVVRDDNSSTIGGKEETVDVDSDRDEIEATPES